MLTRDHIGIRGLNKVGGNALNSLLANGPFELIVNGDFATGDLTGWTNTSLGAGDPQVVSEKAVLTRSPSADLERISQAVATAIGQQYTLTFDISNNNACYLQVGTSQSGTQIHGASYNIGSQSVDFTATTTTTHIAFYCSGVGNENHVDNVSLLAS